MSYDNSGSTPPPPPAVGTLRPKGPPKACIRRPDSEHTGRSRWAYCEREPEHTEFLFEASAWRHVITNYRKGSSKTLEACEVCCERVIEDKANSPTEAAMYTGNKGR